MVMFIKPTLKGIQIYHKPWEFVKKDLQVHSDFKKNTEPTIKLMKPKTITIYPLSN